MGQEKGEGNETTKRQKDERGTCNENAWGRRQSEGHVIKR
jgi:hypothetical protein